MRRAGSYREAELVRFNSTSGLRLTGLLFAPDDSLGTVIHVHGSLGNFHDNEFLTLMAGSYIEAGFTFLTFNLSTHDGLAEGYRGPDAEFEYVGGSVSLFESCVDDIEGAVQFCSQFSDRIVLQGHSLGCDRVVHYSLSRQERGEELFHFILLSPCDSYQLHLNWIVPETLEEQLARLRATPGSGELEWLPSNEYGLRQGTWTYAIPITRQAFLSIADGPPFKLFSFSKYPSYFLNSQALIYIGGKDELQVHNPEAMFEFFSRRIRAVERADYPEGDHNLGGVEQVLISRIVRWLTTLPR